MTRTMYDTTDIPAVGIPMNAVIVAGYLNGLYQSFWDMVHRFPTAEHVSIAVTSHVDADVLDIEKGDATPADAPGWVARQKARGVHRPSCYCAESQADEVIANLNAHGYIVGVDVDLWVAAYPLPGHAPNLTRSHRGEAARQYIDHGPNGENIDISVVYDDGWPHRTPAVPTPHHLFLEEPVSNPVTLVRRHNNDDTPASYTNDKQHTYAYVYDAPGEADGKVVGNGVKLYSRLIVGPSNPTNDGAFVEIWSGTAGQTLHGGNLSAFYNFFPVVGDGRQSVVSDVPLDGYVVTLVVPV